MPARENSVTWFNLEGEELRTLEFDIPEKEKTRDFGSRVSCLLGFPIWIWILCPNDALKCIDCLQLPQHFS
jgi:hypothetical protein